MTIDKKLEGNKLTVSISGKLNAVTSPMLEKELSDLSGISELVLDLKDLEQISSAGLRVILWAQCTMEEQGTMLVANVREVVYDVFVLTGFTKLLTIV